jgi:peptide/nickel transport system substrate-binding protein
VTSADCEFWHRLMMNPDTGTLQRADYPDVVESFEVVDDYTFIMTYNTVYPDFLSEATASCQLPEHVLGPAIDAGEALDDQPFFSGVNPVGYGPYVFTEWRAGEAVEFNRNPNWGINEWEKEPAFDRVILRFVTEAAQMQNAMEVGDIDVAFNFSDDLVEGYQAIEGVEVFGTPGIFGDAVWVNVGNGGHPALSDKNVVRALIHAIDRETLAEELVGPGTSVPLSWYPTQYWADDLPFIEYNVDEANRLLDEAGWVDSNDNGVRDKDGQELVLRFYTTTLQIRMDFQVFIQDYLAEVGVQAQLLPIPSGSLFAVFNERGILATGDFDLAIFALSSSPLSPYVNASTTWFGCEGIPSPENPSGRNGYGFCSPEFDELDAAVGVTVDPDERQALAQQAQHAFFEGYHWHGLYLRQTWYAVDSTVVDPASARNVGTLVNYFNQFEYWEPA